MGVILKFPKSEDKNAKAGAETGFHADCSSHQSTLAARGPKRQPIRSIQLQDAARNTAIPRCDPHLHQKSLSAAKEIMSC